MRASRSPGPEADPEQRAASLAVQHFRGARVPLGDELDEVQPETESFSRPALLRLDRAELLEHAGLEVRGDSRATIRHVDFHRTWQVANDDRDVLPPGRVLEGVAEQVLDRAADQLAVEASIGVALDRRRNLDDLAA